MAALREGEVREVEIPLRDKAYLAMLVPSLNPFVSISLLYDLQPLALCDGQLVLTPVGERSLWDSRASLSRRSCSTSS